jgi:hypothetical protein
MHFNMHCNTPDNELRNNKKHLENTLNVEKIPPSVMQYHCVGSVARIIKHKE